MWIRGELKQIKDRKIYISILCLYTLFILSKTLFFRTPTKGVHLQLELFWSYKVIKVQFWQMLGNVVLFIPFGLLLYILHKRAWVVLLIGVLLSCSIEALQYLLKLGLCELDDVFHNTLGTLIGLMLWKRIEKIVNKGLG